MHTLLMLGSGIFWTITYLLIIRRSILDRSYGMPLVALSANISWEFLFSFVFPTSIAQHIVNIVWFTLDVIIVGLALWYGPREFQDLSKWFFYTVFGISLITGFCIVLFVTLQFYDGSVYTAFGQNLMMSILFCSMLYRRRVLRGQSLSIAICKCIGTSFASLAFSFYASLSRPSVLLPFLFITTFVFDLVYIGLVSRQMQEAKAAREPMVRGWEAQVVSGSSSVPKE